MLYEEFIVRIAELVSEHCDKGDEVKLQKITKNNSVELDALLIRRAGCNISPTIYLKMYYEEYEKGKSIERIAEDILNLEATIRPEQAFDIDGFLNFSNISKFIRAKLINAERNQRLLEKVPHREYLDLAIVYYIAIPECFSGYATTLIYQNHMSTWEISEEELYEIALENTFNEHAMVEDMVSVMQRLLPDDSDEEAINHLEELKKMEEDHMMYIISNKGRILGAIQLANVDLLKNFSEKHGDFYVLPSSIHELIFWPKNSSSDEENMRAMVHEVNTTQLVDEEFLSDNIYLYQQESNELYCIYDSECAYAQ